MDRNTNQRASVEDHQDKPDVKKIKLEEAHQKFPRSNEVCSSSKSCGFANLCRENGAKICDEKNMRIFNRFAKQGEWSF